MFKKSADLIILDPPYNLGVLEDLGDSSTMDEIMVSFAVLAGEAVRILKPGGSVLFMGSPLQQAAWELVAQMAGLRILAEFIVLWDADSEFDTGLYQHRSIRWHIKPGLRLPTPEVASASNIIVVKEVPMERREHVTQLPVELFTYLISLLTGENALIVDPFCGSGSSLVAAEVCERRWVGGDIDNRACLTAESRVKNWESEETNPVLLWKRGRHLIV